MRRCFLSTLLVTAMLAVSPYAGAQEASADPERLFAEATALMDEGKFAEALPKLEEGQRRDPGVGTLFNIGICHEKLGKLGAAWRAFSEVLHLAQASGKKQREEAARAKLDELRPRVASLAVSVQDLDATVKLDGVVVSIQQLPFLPVDPGSHEITAIAPAKKPWSATVEITAEAQKLEVAIPALEAIQAETKLVTVTKETTNTKRTIGYAVGGVGLIGVGAAIVTGILLENALSTAEEKCQPTCIDQDGRDAVSLGTTLLPINGIAWGVAIAGVGVGAYLVLTSPAKKPTAPSARLTPHLGPGGGGAVFTGAF